MTPRVEVLGVYPVEVDDPLVERALAVKYEGLDLSEPEKQRARADVVEELSGVVLIEVRIRDRDDRFDVGDFEQPDSDQAPYDEAFLSDDGTRVLSREDLPEGEPLRIVFFLHFFDPGLPLVTSYGAVKLPALAPMPKRLIELMPYEPVE